MAKVKDTIVYTPKLKERASGRPDLFGHSKRDKLAKQEKFNEIQDQEAYHIWPFEGTPHPVGERHNKH